MTSTPAAMMDSGNERPTGEPDAVKAASPVRRGADGKGPSQDGTSPAAYPVSMA
jgi:hypothetical protein